MAAGRALPLTRIVCGFADGARFKMGASFGLPLSNCKAAGETPAIPVRHQRSTKDTKRHEGDARDLSEAIPVRRKPGEAPQIWGAFRIRRRLTG